MSSYFLKSNNEHDNIVVHPTSIFCDIGDIYCLPTSEVLEEEALGHLAYLKELWLNDNKISGTLPSQLSSLTKLNSLYLENNRLTGQVPEDLADCINMAIVLCS